MKVSLIWILPAFYAGLLLGMAVVALCRAAKAGGEQPRPVEKPEPEQKPEEPKPDMDRDVDRFDAEVHRNIVRLNPGLAPHQVRLKIILGRPGRG